MLLSYTTVDFYLFFYFYLFYVGAVDINMSPSNKNSVYSDTQVTVKACGPLSIKVFSKCFLIGCRIHAYSGLT